MTIREFLSARWICFVLFLFIVLPFSYSQNPILDSLKEKLNQTENPKKRASLLTNLSEYSQPITPRLALSYAQNAYVLSIGLNNDSLLASSLYNISISYYYLGKTDSSLIYLSQARPYAENSDWQSLVVSMFNQEGVILWTTGKYPEAIKVFMDMLDYAKELGEPKSIGAAYNGLGLVHISKKDTIKSVKYFKEAISEFRKINDERNMAIGLGNIGDVLSKQGKIDSAQIYYEENSKIYQKLNDNFNLIRIWGNIASNYIILKDFDKAEFYLEQAEKIARENSITSMLVFILLKKGDLANSLKNYDKAIEYLTESYELSHEQGKRPTKVKIYLALSTAYYFQKDYKNAADRQRNALLLKDSLLNEKNIRQIAEIEAKYETEQREAEIARQKLQLAEERQRNFIILGGAGLILLLITVLFQRSRLIQQNRRKEAEIAFKVQETEALYLKEMDLVKSRFFANISHEFRTPLTMILGPLTKLIETQTNNKDQTRFQMMRRNAQRLLNLVNQLLDLSKIESGKMMLNLTEGDMIGFIKGIVMSYESYAESKNIQFHTYFPDKHLPTSFDRDKIEKTLTNLLSNAFKFTPEEGDVAVTVNILSETNLEILEIEVKDNGIGIPEDQLVNIFDRFYRIEGNEFEGTGIGLALVKELVELHRGEIIVSSEPNKGSIFLVRIPVILSNLAENVQVHKDVIPAPRISHSVDQSLDYQTNIPTLLKKPILLIVEDNSDVRYFLKDTLEDKYEIIEAEDGQQGLDTASKLIPDLIISDIMMPKMDGVEFTYNLKTDERTSHIPVVLLTAKAGQESKIVGLETGADDYLTKPFDAKELKIRIQNLITQRRILKERFSNELISIEPSDVSVTSADNRFLSKAIATVEEHMDNEAFTVEDLGREIGMSRSQLHRKLKGLIDQSPSVFIRTLRLKRAWQFLEQKAGTASEISYLVGFGSPAYFSKCFKDQFGISPGEVGQ